MDLSFSGTVKTSLCRDADFHVQTQKYFRGTERHLQNMTRLCAVVHFPLKSRTPRNGELAGV